MSLVCSVDNILFPVLPFKLQFENSRDAEDAIRGRDGYSFAGHRLRVTGIFFYSLILP